MTNASFGGGASGAGHPLGMTLLAMALLAGITFIYRYSFISTRGKALATKIPQSFLSLLAPAAFAAIIANHLLAAQPNSLEFKQKLIAALLSLSVAYVTKNVLVTLLFGLGVLHVLQAYNLVPG